jgi:hypothetical protein
LEEEEEEEETDIELAPAAALIVITKPPEEAVVAIVDGQQVKIKQNYDSKAGLTLQDQRSAAYTRWYAGERAYEQTLDRLKSECDDLELPWRDVVIKKQKQQKQKQQQQQQQQQKQQIDALVEEDPAAAAADAEAPMQDEEMDPATAAAADAPATTDTTAKAAAADADVPVTAADADAATEDPKAAEAPMVQDEEIERLLTLLETQKESINQAKRDMDGFQAELDLLLVPAAPAGKNDTAALDSNESLINMDNLDNVDEDGGAGGDADVKDDDDAAKGLQGRGEDNKGNVEEQQSKEHAAAANDNIEKGDDNEEEEDAPKNKRPLHSVFQFMRNKKE